MLFFSFRLAVIAAEKQTATVLEKTELHTFGSDSEINSAAEQYCDYNVGVKEIVGGL